MSIAELNVRHKAEHRGFRAHKLDRHGACWLLYRHDGTVETEGSLETLDARLDEVLVEAVRGLSPEFKQTVLEVLNET